MNMNKEYRLYLSSHGHSMSPVEFEALSDEEARYKAKETLELQKKLDSQGTAGIVCLERIDVREKVTEIRM